MTTRQMLQAIGLRAPRATPTFLPSVALFSVGLITGAITAVLLAPRPGKELRRQVSRQARQIQERAQASRTGEEAHARRLSRSGPDYSASPSHRS